MSYRRSETALYAAICQFFGNNAKNMGLTTVSE